MSTTTASQPQRTSQQSAPTTWPWRSYAVLASLIAAALALNLVLRNPLWAWYSTIGLVASLLIAGLDWRLDWHLPPVLLRWAGVPIAMHYLGGSLSGVHQIGGPNGLYWVFPWWDNVVHFLGTGAAAVVAIHVLAPHIARKSVRILVATACAATAGSLVELYEFLGFIWFQTIDQGYYTNTMLDLYYNLLGAATFAWAYSNRSSQLPRTP